MTLLVSAVQPADQFVTTGREQPLADGAPKGVELGLRPEEKPGVEEGAQHFEVAGGQFEGFGDGPDAVPHVETAVPERVEKSFGQGLRIGGAGLGQADQQVDVGVRVELPRP